MAYLLVTRGTKSVGNRRFYARKCTQVRQRWSVRKENVLNCYEFNEFVNTGIYGATQNVWEGKLREGNFTRRRGI